MCGICGFISKNDNTGSSGEQKQMQQKIRSAVLEDMMNVICHRGPDDGRMYLDGQAALGFRRLSILDLEGSAQPMTSENRDRVLVFNGEIYNYRELRKELQECGCRFHTQGDAEVLLHGYGKWGDRLPEHLRGMFAFAIWDAEKEEVFLARDHFGIKPLYYILYNKTFVFASEIKSILEYPGIPRILNEKALEQYLSFQYSVLDETFFQGIYRLEPGNWLKHRAGSSGITVRRYFSPELAPEPDRRGKAGILEEKRWAEEIERVMKESIRLHGRADVEVGAFLSGGVDSAFAAALLSCENSEEQREAGKKSAYGKRAYTVGFGPEDSAYNETARAGQIAEKYGLIHRSRRIEEEEFWEAVPEVLYYMDEPLGDASAVSLYFLAREAARDVKAVVSGEGSDELFGGYRIYCEPGVLNLYQKLPQKFRNKAAQLAQKLPDVKGKNFLIRGSMSVEERFIGNAKIFSYEERCALLKNPPQTVSPAELLENDYRRTRGMRDADRMQEIDLRHWLAGDILLKADRMSMAHSLELRVPFLDREVFALTRRLPGRQKQRFGKTKRALRLAAAGYLPEDAASRPKLGFPVPLRLWFLEPYAREKLMDAFRSEAAEKYFCQDELMRLLEEHGQGRCDNSRKLWTIYTFCVWYSIYFYAETDKINETEKNL